MAGKLLGTFLILAFLTYMVLLSSFYFVHQSIIMNVNNLNYNVCELIATSGTFSEHLFHYLQENINRYGKYKITIKLERQIKPGVYDTFYAIEDIIDKKFNIGDRVTIYCEDQEDTVFGRLINVAFLGYKSDRFLDTRIKSLKSSMVAINAKDLVKGYDVIAEISKRNLNGDFDRTEPLGIMVVTKLNPQGKVYNGLNRVYGDEVDEKDSTGLNYIFDNGDFFREESYYSDGSGILTGISEIKYIQQ